MPEFLKPQAGFRLPVGKIKDADLALLETTTTWVPQLPFSAKAAGEKNLDGRSGDRRLEYAHDRART
jgi:hypothetical protein